MARGKHRALRIMRPLRELNQMAGQVQTGRERLAEARQRQAEVHQLEQRLDR
jgi:hypothetical protein